MASPQSSLQIEHAVDGSGVGVIDITLDQNGVAVAAPARHLQDGLVLHETVQIVKEILAAQVSNHLWTCPGGRWQVADVAYIPRVVGTGGAATIDVRVGSGVVAPASAVTQLGAALDLVGTADTIQRAALIATPTPIGPGDNVDIVISGTLTSVVGLFRVSLKRLG